MGNLRREQEQLKRAMVRLIRACFDQDAANRPLKDVGTTFLLLAQAAMSAVIAERVGAEFITRPGAIDSIIKFSTAALEDRMRQDLEARLEHERRKARH